MSAWLLTSRLSPFSTSLISPPNLPEVPSLAELQRQAEAYKSVIMESAPAYLPPSLTRNKTPPRSVPIFHSVAQPVRSGHTPPPSYTSAQDYFGYHQVEIGGTPAVGDGGRKLKKGIRGWRRLQGGIPGEEPRMKSSIAYGGQTQPLVDEKVVDEEQPRTFWQWVTCR